MKQVKLHNFVVSIPEKYNVKKMGFFWKSFSFFFVILFKFWSQIGLFLMTHPPKLGMLIGRRLFVIKMGEHTFSFYTEITDSEPEELGEFIESQTLQPVKLKDLSVKDFKGKKYGDYSEVMSWIDWWIKKGQCMIYFNFQGLGMPSEETRDDVSEIINSLKYIDKRKKV
ncbi:MAG: hypothetical protein ACYSUK_03585 [Planctomycetota bacterium]|jgi:hypothetical protein